MRLRTWMLVLLALASACKDAGAHGDSAASSGAGGGPSAGSDPQAVGGQASVAGSAAGVGGAGATGGRGGVDCGIAGCGQSIPVDMSRVDMLFVIDNSGSMAQEQAALAREFPRLLRKLTSGDHDGDGTAEQTRVTDLHLAVVSTNLGTYIPDIRGCEGGGDDGRLVRMASDPACQGEYPAFLGYEAGSTEPGELEADFSCIAQLGTAGCGYEQPLESALKALWPSSDPRMRFLAQDSEGSLGRGDRDNTGFLRNGQDGRAATLAIVLITDEDDCSVFDTSLWTPSHFLTEDDPLRTQPVNLRCFYNPQNRYALERYLHGYRALHARTDARVVFAAIAGVPVDLVDQQAMAAVDFADDSAREAYYQKILDDPRMIEMPDPNATPGREDLIPSCTSEFGRAYPPRRIVELARKFGRDGLVQSICGDNFGPPIDIVVKRVVRGPD